MSKLQKFLIVLGVLAAAGAVVATKEMRRTGATEETRNPPVSSLGLQRDKGDVRPAVPAPKGEPATPPSTSVPLPTLVDLGADKCIPCKMMAPILEELKEEYAGVFDVQFIDVWEEPDAGEPYGIRIIPTQIFFDESGKEQFRHEGFFGKEDILAKWQDLGVDLPD